MISCLLRIYKFEASIFLNFLCIFKFSLTTFVGVFLDVCARFISSGLYGTKRAILYIESCNINIQRRILLEMHMYYICIFYF